MRKGKDVQAITPGWYTVVRGKRERRGPGNYLIFWLLDGERSHTPTYAGCPHCLGKSGVIFSKKKKQIKKENIMLVDVATVKRSGDAEVGFQIYLSLKVGGCRNFQKKWELQKLVSYILFIVERVVYDIN